MIMAWICCQAPVRSARILAPCSLRKPPMMPKTVVMMVWIGGSAASIPALTRAKVGEICARTLIRPWTGFLASVKVAMRGPIIAPMPPSAVLTASAVGSLRPSFSRKLLTAERQEKIAKYFERYGAWIIFAARFLPGIRSPLFLTAGSMRVSFWTFFGMDGAAALVSIPTSFWIAYYFTDKLEELLHLRERVHYWALLLVAAGLLGWLLLHRLWNHWWDSRKARTGAAKPGAEQSRPSNTDEVTCKR